MKIIYIPLEHIDMRYTSHLDESITSYLTSTGKKFIKISPKMKQLEKIVHGSFLDASYTIEYKSKQMVEIANLYRRDLIDDDDIFFFSDLWFPGIEGISYMNYFCKKRTKIRGLLHAGSFTDTDFVRDMERWAKNFEDIIFDIVDKIYVGSNFIKNDVIKKRFLDPNKVVVTGFPIDSVNLCRYQNVKKENIVIFNGRNVDEKQPWLFDKLSEIIGDKAEFVNTQKKCYDKSSYYDLLSRVKVIVSFALQENFGFGILEAVYLGVIPILPKRLVYPEFFDDVYLYSTFDECVLKVINALDNNMLPPSKRDFQQSIGEWFK